MKIMFLFIMLSAFNVSAYSGEITEDYELEKYDGSAVPALSDYRDEDNNIDNNALIKDLLPISPATMLNIIAKLGGQ